MNTQRAYWKHNPALDGRSAHFLLGVDGQFALILGTGHIVVPDQNY